MKKDVAAWGKNVADDYTVFEGAFPTRIDGKAMMARIAEGNFSSSDTMITAEMATSIAVGARTTTRTLGWPIILAVNGERNSLNVQPHNVETS